MVWARFGGIHALEIARPSYGQRQAAARLLVRRIAGQATVSPETTLATVRTFSESTDGLTLQAMSDISQLAVHQKIPPNAIDDAIRAFKVGNVRSPWKAAHMRERIATAPPKMIRTELIGEIVPEPLSLADQPWNSPTLDIEQGALVLLPNSVVVDEAMLNPERNVPSGRLFRAAKCGITRIAIPGTSWASYVRISRCRYVGLARFRHLEENEDE